MDNAKEVAKILKIFSVEARVLIVHLLKGRSMCVNALAAHLDMTQGAVSQHLRIMRDVGLVIDEKKGYFVHYRLAEDVLGKWKEMVDVFLDPAQRMKPKCKREC